MVGSLRRFIAHRRRGRELAGTAPEVNEPDVVGEAFMELDAHGFLTKALTRYEARLARQQQHAITLLVTIQRARQLRGTQEPRDGSSDTCSPADAAHLSGHTTPATD